MKNNDLHRKCLSYTARYKFWIQSKANLEFFLPLYPQRHKHFLERVVLHLLRDSIVLTSNHKRICHPFLGQQSPRAEKAFLHNPMPPNWLHLSQLSSLTSQFLYFHTSKMLHLQQNYKANITLCIICVIHHVFKCLLITYIGQDGP